MSEAMEAPNKRVTVTLPGNSLKTDLTGILEMAALIIQNPGGFSASDKQGCVVGLQLLARSVI